MIYYVTKVNVLNGDETVMSSHDNSVSAIAAHSNYSNSNTDEYVRFRIDTVLSTSEEIAEANKRIPPKLPTNKQWEEYKAAEKKKLNNLLGKFRTKDFTANELFGNPASLENLECFECGAHVLNHRKHVQWHNKLLP